MYTSIGHSLKQGVAFAVFKLVENVFKEVNITEYGTITAFNSLSDRLMTFIL